MKRKVEDWSVEKIDKERTRISFPEYQREKALWSNEKKSVLIDSILHDIDIPKLYFNLLKDKDIEVIDGQQRLWSVWDFLDDKFEYKVDGKAHTFSKLTPAQRQKIKDYKFQITLFEDANDAYLRVLFVRLQLGLLLNTGEKLHAETGKMKHLVFDKFAGHDFIQHIGIPARRYAKQTLCAQICINSFLREKRGDFARTRYEDLAHFFNEYADPQGKDLEVYKKESGKIWETLDVLWDCFGTTAGNLKNRSYILSIYLFIEEIFQKHGRPPAKELKLFASFAFRLWKRLKEESHLGIDRNNRELYSFETLLSSAPGEAYQIERRHKKLGEYYEHFKGTGKIKGD